ncbi:hypothetical protein A2V61_02005 [Candidatus Woesebacteria bacterium RBG_19FT_COMBO_47_8]|nr:MAG: hypothetical protein A2V61_02005 [Candidatus Woesebacteria bacterium RBG_19FT_COMBO_47_8]
MWEEIWKKIKESEWLRLYIFVAVVLIVVGTIIAGGGVWLTDKIIHWLLPISASVLAVSLFLLFPLGVFRKTRRFAGKGLFLASDIFGLILWLWSLLLTYRLQGLELVFVGLVFFGVGIVIAAMYGALYNGLWGLFLQLVLVAVFLASTRLLGTYLLVKVTPKEVT